MRRLATLSLLLWILSALVGPGGFAASDPALVLTYAPAAQDPWLFWTGGTSTFGVYRSADPATVRTHANLEIETTELQWIDAASPGGITFYVVIEYCDPLNPEPVCGADAHCIPQMDFIPICEAGTGSSTQFESCNGGNQDCAPEFECREVPGAFCHQWCLPGRGDCPTDVGPILCVGQFAGIGTQQWGLCLPDPPP